MNPEDVTAEQVTEALHLALKDGDMPAAASLLRLLAVKDPAAAELVLFTINAVAEMKP